MLVLSRQRDDQIIIGDDIVITLVDIRGDKARVGINAPREIPVHRREVYDAIQREKRKAAQANAGKSATTEAAEPSHDEQSRPMPGKQPKANKDGMLVLSRKMTESIMIGANIIVVIVEIRGDKVRIGIDAPGDIPVHRKEVYDAIKRHEQPGQGSQQA